MYVQESGVNRIDGIICCDGEFTWHRFLEATPRIKLTMVYMNRESGTTFGTCPMNTISLSPETLEAFSKFLDCAERDFGQVVFGSGEIVNPDNPFSQGAETDGGLKPLGGI